MIDDVDLFFDQLKTLKDEIIEFILGNGIPHVIIVFMVILAVFISRLRTAIFIIIPLFASATIWYYQFRSWKKN